MGGVISFSNSAEGIETKLGLVPWMKLVRSYGDMRKTWSNCIIEQSHLELHFMDTAPVVLDLKTGRVIDGVSEH